VKPTWLRQQAKDIMWEPFDFLSERWQTCEMFFGKRIRRSKPNGYDNCLVWKLARGMGKVASQADHWL